MNEFGLPPAQAMVSMSDLAVQLGIGVVISVIIRWHFIHFSSVLSNRRELGRVFPFICLTTLLVISVVKSSLALSLGLVGALSIVRFRTPIKEPEELAYLFLAIAVGLGLGANQTAATVITTIAILTFMAIFKHVEQSGPQEKNVFLSVAVDQRVDLDTINRIVTDHLGSIDLRRYSSTGNRTESIYFVGMEEPSALSKMTEAFKEEFPDGSISFIDQPRVPGL